MAMMDFDILMVSFISILLLSNIIFDINWLCLLRIHKYAYVGEKHGMYIRDQKVVGTQRKMYVCYKCKKNKPIENKDFI